MMVDTPASPSSQDNNIVICIRILILTMVAVNQLLHPFNDPYAYVTSKADGSCMCLLIKVSPKQKIRIFGGTF